MAPSSRTGISCCDVFVSNVSIYPSIQQNLPVVLWPERDRRVGEVSEAEGTVRYGAYSPIWWSPHKSCINFKELHALNLENDAFARGELLGLSSVPVLMDDYEAEILGK